MALTPAEKQHRYRERKKDREDAAPDRTPVRLEAFAAFVAEDAQHNEMMFIGETLASVGFDLPDLSNDVDPEWTPDWHTPNRGALGKAERLIDAFVDCGRALAEIVNAFKLREVEAAKARLAERDLSTDQARREAIAEGVRLEKIESRLRKQVRHSFPTIEVKEE